MRCSISLLPEPVRRLDPIVVYLFTNLSHLIPTLSRARIYRYDGIYAKIIETNRKLEDKAAASSVLGH